MSKLKLNFFLWLINQYLNKSKSFSSIEDYIYDYAYNEVEIEINDPLNKIIFILISYFPSLENKSEEDKHKIMNRLVYFLQDEIDLKERTILALYYEQIESLIKSYESNKIEEKVYLLQMKKCSNEKFNLTLLEKLYWRNRKKLEGLRA